MILSLIQNIHVKTTTVKDIKITYGRILARFLDSKSHLLDNIGVAGQLAHNQLCIGNWFCTRTSGIFGRHLHWLFPLAHYTESLKNKHMLDVYYIYDIYISNMITNLISNQSLYLFELIFCHRIGFWFLNRNN